MGAITKRLLYCEQPDIDLTGLHEPAFPERPQTHSLVTAIALVQHSFYQASRVKPIERPPR